MQFRTRDYLFLAAAAILVAIIGPYIYFTGIIYMYIHDYAGTGEATESFTLQPNLRDLWISVLSAVIIYFSHSYMEKYLDPFMCAIAKHVEGEGETLRNFKAKKSIHNLHMTIWHIYCAVGHWYVIKNKPWTPWFMGGSGNFVDGFVNMPFSPMD